MQAQPSLHAMKRTELNGDEKKKNIRKKEKLK
jgi:hypothetical protein